MSQLFEICQEESTKQFVNRLQNRLSKLTLESIDFELRRAESIIKRQGEQSRNFMKVVRILQKRQQSLKLILDYEQQLKHEQTQLKLLIRKIEIIKLENAIKGMDYKCIRSCERNVSELDSLLNKIKEEVEYEPNPDQYYSAQPQAYNRWHEQSNYEELFKNIMALQAYDQKQGTVEKARESKTLNNQLLIEEGDTSESERTSLKGKLFAFLGQRTGKILDTLAQIAGDVGITEEQQ